MNKKNNQLLSEVSYYVLLVLIDENHGYEIIKEVANLTGNRIKMAPGTVYSILENFKKQGWIDAISVDVQRRKTYKINLEGKKVLKENFFFCTSLIEKTKEKWEEIENV